MSATHAWLHNRLSFISTFKLQQCSDKTQIRRSAMDDMRNETFSLEACGHDQDICNRAITVYQAMLLICIPFNVIHLVVQYSMKDMRCSAYGKILQHMTLADIVASAVAFSQTICEFRLWLQKCSLPAIIIMTSLACVLSGLKYSLLALAMYEKYLAICMAFHYEESFVIRQTHAACVLVSVALLVWWHIFNAINGANICMHEIHGLTLLDSDNIVAAAVIFVFMVLTCVFVTALLTKLIKELLRMQKRARPGDVALFQATVYIVMTVIVYFFILAPIFTSFILKLTMGKELEGLEWVASWLNGLYGYINVVIYGFLISAYRKKLSDFAQMMCKRQDRVQPQQQIQVQPA